MSALIGSHDHHSVGLKAIFAAACLTGCGEAALSQTQSQSQEGNNVEQAASASSYAGTKYPIVLVHGMAGFKALFGAVEYFYGIPESMRSSGAQVYVTEASSFNSAELRGEQVLLQVESIIARTGAAKVNLIGHSQGGLDARYVASVRPDLVASVTTVGTPHKGAALADYLRAHLSNGGFDQFALAAFANQIGFLLGLLEGAPALPQNALGTLDSLSSSGAQLYNQKYPNGIPSSSCGSGASAVSGMQYYSWAGTGVVTNIFDVSDAAFALSTLVYPEANDGVVGHCSAHFGTVIRDDYRLNHLDEVNQILGLTPLFGTDPVALFRAHASRLKAAGL